MQLKKEQQTGIKQKIKENLTENALEAVEPYFGPKICSTAPLSNIDNVLCGRSLMKISNNWTERKKMQNYVIFFFR